MSGAGDVLTALGASAGALPVAVTLVRQRPWASALFVGERLRVAVTAGDDEALDAWLAVLPDVELTVRRGFVASVEVVERAAGRAVLDVLVVDT